MKREISYYNIGEYIKETFFLPLILLEGMGFLDRMVIGGSMGLVMNKLMFRKIKDIDLITLDDFYSKDTYLNNFTISTEIPSTKFFVDNNLILCKKIEVLDINLDLLYNKAEISRYEDVVITDLPFPKSYLEIKLEDPLVAFKFKTRYIESDKCKTSVEKHKEDIYQIINNLR